MNTDVSVRHNRSTLLLNLTLSSALIATALVVALSSPATTTAVAPTAELDAPEISSAKPAARLCSDTSCKTEGFCLGCTSCTSCHDGCILNETGPDHCVEPPATTTSSTDLACGLTTTETPCVGGDPFSSWMNFVRLKANGTITRVTANWVVPGKPANVGDSAPSWWYGLQVSGN